VAVELIRAKQDWVGLAADTKPTAPPIGSTFLETDTGALYVYAGGAWNFLPTGRLLRATKTITFTGAANLGAVGNVPLFTVTGEVLVLYIAGFCSVDLVGATATLALGVTGSTALFIAATTATDVDAGDIWVDTAPDPNGVALPAALKEIEITDNIVGTVAVADITGGAVRVDAWWLPMSANGNVVPA
jgi:hypothetical protein